MATTKHSSSIWVWIMHKTMGMMRLLSLCTLAEQTNDPSKKDVLEYAVFDNSQIGFIEPKQQQDDIRYALATEVPQ